MGTLDNMDQQLDKIRAYIEKHDLQGKVSAAVTKCVQTLPEDPNAFLASCFAEASPKKAAPAKPVAGPAAETAAMLFAKADANHDGVLSKSEIKKFLKNQEPSLKKAFGVAEGGWESLWAACDLDGDKTISLEEWKALYTSKVGGAAGGDAKESKKQSKKEKKEAKKIKAVEKEGGKKGVEIEGAADMGGLAFFCTT